MYPLFADISRGAKPVTVTLAFIRFCQGRVGMRTMMVLSGPIGEVFGLLSVWLIVLIYFPEARLGDFKGQG
jgi:hypothetical protein